jgi:hypothetical protein
MFFNNQLSMLLPQRKWNIQDRENYFPVLVILERSEESSTGKERQAREIAFRFIATRR